MAEPVPFQKRIMNMNNESSSPQHPGTQPDHQDALATATLNQTTPPSRRRVRLSTVILGTIVVAVGAATIATGFEIVLNPAYVVAGLLIAIALILIGSAARGPRKS